MQSTGPKPTISSRMRLSNELKQAHHEDDALPIHDRHSVEVDEVPVSQPPHQAHFLCGWVGVRAGGRVAGEAS